MLFVLSEELEITDDSGFLRLAAADLEERDDSEYRNDTHADGSSDRNDNGNSENYRDNAEQNVHNRELERLTHMESGVIGLVRRKKGDNDADGAEQIAKHCDDLVSEISLGSNSAVWSNGSALAAEAFAGSKLLPQEGQKTTLSSHCAPQLEQNFIN